MEPVPAREEPDEPLPAVRPEEVREDFDKAIRLDPAFAAAYKQRAEFWQSMNNPENALADFSKAIELGCRDHGVFLARALIWKNQADLPRALADFDEAIRLRVAEDQEWFRAHPESPDADEFASWRPDDNVEMDSERIWELRPTWSSDMDLSRFHRELNSSIARKRRREETASLYDERASVHSAAADEPKARADTAEAERLRGL